jgi:hypothetical protein
MAFYDLDGKTRRAIALDDLVMAMSLETIEHEEGCGCDLCRALEAVDVLPQLSLAPGTDRRTHRTFPPARRAKPRLIKLVAFKVFLNEVRLPSVNDHRKGDQDDSQQHPPNPAHVGTRPTAEIDDSANSRKGTQEDQGRHRLRHKSKQGGASPAFFAAQPPLHAVVEGRREGG